MGYFCCGHSGGPKLAFHWSAACLGWQPLWWGVISFQNFRSLKLRLYFCVDFLASSELIGYIDLTGYYELWTKCSLVINAKKGMRLFWYSKYFSFWPLLCDEDRLIFNSVGGKIHVFSSYNVSWSKFSSIRVFGFKFQFISCVLLVLWLDRLNCKEWWRNDSIQIFVVIVKNYSRKKWLVNVYR